MLSYSRPVERCRPLLGTFVRIRVEGLEPERAHAAIDVAFDEVAQVHRLMSSHDAHSDVSQLNRLAHLGPVGVDVRTYEVLVRASQIADDSGGAFDITVASELVARGRLPPPAGAPPADTTAMWRDVKLLDGFRIAFMKPLWIDLGGIAKGYAVDHAIALLLAFSPTQVIVNAGGDLRVVGARSERVRLAPDHCVTAVIPVVDIENGSLASSSGRMSGRRAARTAHCAHVDPCRLHHISPQQFVAVAAPSCMDADALTKVVMARGTCSAPALAKHAARALVHDAQFGWRMIGGAV